MAGSGERENLANLDKIFIQGLTFRSLIGVYDFERENSTSLIADLVLYKDMNQASMTDNLSDTVDYAAIVECVKQVGESSQFQLLESLAHAIFQSLFQRFDIAKVELTLYKPNILPDCAKVGIHMVKER